MTSALDLHREQGTKLTGQNPEGAAIVAGRSAADIRLNERYKSGLLKSRNRV